LFSTASTSFASFFLPFTLVSIGRIQS
jgi:hypothetical protein